MNVRVLFVLSLLVGCVSEKSSEPAPPAAPTAPVAAAPASPPEPSARQLPIAADFRAEASKAITAETYKAELTAIAKELEADENAP